MGVAHVKTRINHNDSRVKEGGVKKKIRKEDKDKAVLRESTQAHSSLFFQCNTSLKPPYQILLDTNFINMSIQMKLDVFQASMECMHKGTYADDCICDRVVQHKCYIVGTND